ncbi:MAG: PDZ domain-containing protein [Myxococcales bacterium]|nr:PDZ domain-containing protein [Myxococcales bacterium]
MWLWVLSVAVAGDLAAYRGALQLVDDQYLWPERIDHGRMFRAAANRLEKRVERLQVDANEASARLRMGARTWTVPFRGDLPGALDQLEDAVANSGAEVDEGVDLRAELLKGALSTLDRHTVMLAGEGLERFDERLTGTLTGIGVTLKLVDRSLHIVEVFPNGPAARGGIEAGDLLLRIDGISTEGMLPADATTHIRGRIGSRVRLTVLRAQAELEVELERVEIAIPNVTGAAGPRGVGVVKIDHFSEQTLPNLERVLADLRQQGLLDVGVVLDLRGNSGGSLSQSARAADVFVDDGRIVTTAGRDGGKVPGLTRGFDARADTRLPLPATILLVDHETASGAEILAGALAHLDRATMLGETTFGKGTVQTLYEIADGLKLKLTVAEYRVGQDVRVNEVGLAPDLALYPVRLGTQRFWYPDAARLRARGDGRAPILHYPDLGRIDEQDDVLEVAAAILASGTEPSRASVLAAQSSLLPSLAAIQASRLVDALAGESLDWSPAPGPSGPPAVRIVAVGGPMARAGERGELRFEVANDGGELFRAAIRLRSANMDYDDLVVPIGHLTAGQTRTVSTTVTPAIDSPSRVDRLVGVLECDGCTPIAVLDDTRTIEGGAPPALHADARLVDGNVEVTVQNRGTATLAGVRINIPFPDLLGVQLGAADGQEHTLVPGAEVVVRQRITITADTPLALRLTVRADGWAQLADWSLPIGHDGAVTSRDAPTVTINAPRARQAPGTATIQVQAADPDGIDHLIVWAGPERVDRARWDASVDWEEEKVAWRGDYGRRAHLAVTVPVVSGTNRFVVVAEDAHGISTRRTLYVYGEGEVADDGVALPQ